MATTVPRRSERDYDLVEVPRVEEYIGTTDSTTIVKMIVNYVSNFIEGQLVSSDIIEGGYCHRRFIDTDYTLAEYTGNNRKHLLLRQYPINSITTITLDGTTLFPSGSSTLADLGFYISNDITGAVFYDNIWTVDLPNNITITYNGGYSQIPFDLEYAALFLSARMWERKGKEILKSERLGDYSYTVQDINEDNPFGDGTIKQTLDRYRIPEL